MSKDQADEGVYEFGPFRLDVGQRLLSREGRHLPVMPKVFDLLVVLVRSQGRLQTKETLARDVWPGTFVDEGSLARTVSRLRSLLGDGGPDGSFLETKPKQGYRFVAGVRSIAHSRLQDRTLAVLPFRFIGTASTKTEGLGLGIADALVTRLSRHRSLRVRPTSAVVRFQGDDVDAIEAGRHLGVGLVLEGRVQVREGRGRVTVQLVDLGAGTPVWGEVFEDASCDLYRLQDSIAHRVISALAVPAIAEPESPPRDSSTSSAVAGRLYLRARSLTYRYEPEAIRRAIDLHGLAVEVDPSFAAAHAGLGAANLISAGTFLPAAEAIGRAWEAIRLALDLDDSIAEAHVSHSMLLFWHDRDIKGGEAAVRRALGRAPNDPLAHHVLAWQLTARALFPDATRAMDRPAELDPRSVAIATDLGFLSTTRAGLTRRWRGSERREPSTPTPGTRATSRGSP